MNLEDKDERKLIFVGGIHGVGKSTICLKIVDSIKEVYGCTASDIIKGENNWQHSGKSVEDVTVNQNFLINGLSRIRAKNILLDGHFVLIDKSQTIVPVPFDTFKQMVPVLIIVITDKIEDILNRLVKRDNKLYDLTFLKKMQEMEIETAKRTAQQLSIPFKEINLQADNIPFKTLSSLLSKYI